MQLLAIAGYCASLRLVFLGLKDLSDYRALLEKDAAQWRQFDGLCRVSISRFYRDQGVWSCLERDLLPQLAVQASVRGGTRLRIWSAGCASGEEPYSEIGVSSRIVASPSVQCAPRSPSGR